MTKEKIIDLMKEKEKDGGILFFQKSGEDFAAELLANWRCHRVENVLMLRQIVRFIKSKK